MCTYFPCSPRSSILSCILIFFLSEKRSTVYIWIDSEGQTFFFVQYIYNICLNIGCWICKIGFFKSLNIFAFTSFYKTSCKCCDIDCSNEGNSIKPARLDASSGKLFWKIYICHRFRVWRHKKTLYCRSPIQSCGSLILNNLLNNLVKWEQFFS